MTGYEQCLPALLKGSRHACSDLHVRVESVFAVSLENFGKGGMKFVGFGGELFRPFLLLGAEVKSVYFYLPLGAEFHVFIWFVVFVPQPGCLWPYLVISSP